MSEPAALAICQYANEDGFYLFYCSPDWKTITDTWHESLEDALAQAEFEFQGSRQHMVFSHL